MRKLLAAAAIVMILGAMAWANWDRLAPTVGPVLGIQPTAVPTEPASATALVPAPPQRLRFALIDPTASTDPSFRESMKADLISALRSYVPPKPRTTDGGAPGLVGLQLTVRLVATNSLAYGQQNVTVSIPSVPGLPPSPDMMAPGALDPGGPHDTWKTSEAAWSAAHDAASAAAAESARQLGTLDLNVEESSGITAGAAALALLAPAQGQVEFAVFSDLDENRPKQPAAFHGHPILVVQPDPAGDIGRWDSLFDQFSSWASASGAGQITRVRPEGAVPAIATFITGK